MAPEYKKKYGFSSFWPPLLVLVIMVGIGELLTARYRLMSRTAFVIVLVCALLLEGYTLVEERHSHFRRAFAATVLLVAAVTAIEIEGVANLIRLLLSGDPNIHGSLMLVSGAYYWAANVLAFSLWFWLIDRGGPHVRAAGRDRRADFFFPEMAAGELGNPQWSPNLVEYIYLAFTNATAFSPTDTLPLSTRARALMMAESVISLVIIALVLARSVNILK